MLRISPKFRQFTAISLVAALGLSAGLALAAAAAAPAPLTPAETEKLKGVLARFDAAQGGMRTLTAAFTERKVLAMLKEPVVSKGKFFYTKPDDVLWQYTDPDTRYFLISKDELLTYFPTKKRAERVSIAMFHDRLLKVLAIGQASQALQKYYDIRLEEQGNDVPGTDLLVLAPRKRMVRKRIQAVRLWISQERSLPVRMQYQEPDGDTTTITFDSVLLNPEIAAATYKIDIPKDVPIKRGFSGMSEGKGNSQG